MTVYILFDASDGNVMGVYATLEMAREEQKRSPFSYDRYIGVHEVIGRS